MLVFNRFEHTGICGIAGFGLGFGGQTKLFKENFLKLLGGGDIERMKFSIEAEYNSAEYLIGRIKDFHKLLNVRKKFNENNSCMGF